MGYKLLQNPKDTSPYQIKMIKTWSGISPEFDRIDKRDTSYIDKERIIGYHKESYSLVACFGAVPTEHCVPTEESIADKEISSFFRKKHKNIAQRKTKSFWSILRQNLANK